MASYGNSSPGFTDISAADFLYEPTNNNATDFTLARRYDKMKGMARSAIYELMAARQQLAAAKSQLGAAESATNAAQCEAANAAADAAMTRAESEIVSTENIELREEIAKIRQQLSLATAMAAHNHKQLSDTNAQLAAVREDLSAARNVYKTTLDELTNARKIIAELREGAEENLYENEFEQLHPYLYVSAEVSCGFVSAHAAHCSYRRSIGQPVLDKAAFFEIVRKDMTRFGVEYKMATFRGYYVISGVGIR